MTASRVGFLVLFALVAGERLVELFVSGRNARRTRARGGVAGESRVFYATMVAVHTLFLGAAPLEVILLKRPFFPWLGYPMLGLAIAAQGLRWWAVRALGGRWSTRVIVVPGDPAVGGGPYRFARHPNYLAVVVEMFALPLVHTAWLSALAFSAANAALLARRVAHEETALATLADYGERMGARRRFLPGDP